MAGWQVQVKDWYVNGKSTELQMERFQQTRLDYKRVDMGTPPNLFTWNPMFLSWPYLGVPKLLNSSKGVAIFHRGDSLWRNQSEDLLLNLRRNFQTSFDDRGKIYSDEHPHHVISQDWLILDPKNPTKLVETSIWDPTISQSVSINIPMRIQLETALNHHVSWVKSLMKPITIQQIHRIP